MTEISRSQEMTLSGWQGGTAGFRVRSESRARVLERIKKSLRQVVVELPGHGTRPRCRITATFWTTCPELRSAEIGRWMESQGDKPWPLGKPPRYRAVVVAMDGGSARIRVLGQTSR